MFALGDRRFTWYALLFVGGLLGGYAIAVTTFIRRACRHHLREHPARVRRGRGRDRRPSRRGVLLRVAVLPRPPRAHRADLARRAGEPRRGDRIPLTLWLYARIVIKKPLLWVLGSSGRRDRARGGVRAIRQPDQLGDPGQADLGRMGVRVPADRRHPAPPRPAVRGHRLPAAVLRADRPESAETPLPQGCLSGLFLVGMFLPRWLLEFTKEGKILAGA